MDYISEAIGTFVLVSVIMFYSDNPIVIGLTLIVAIYLASTASKGAVNPAVSFGFWLKGNLTTEKTIGYIFAEIMGAFLAYFWYKQILLTSSKNVA